VKVTFTKIPGKKNPWVVTVITLLLIAGLGVGGWFLYQHLTKPATEETSVETVAEEADIPTVDATETPETEEGVE
jgi:hypothetical protein